MPSFEFVTVDVFTDKRFGGNPLAVFPDAGGLDLDQMQAIAREFNLSETTFVLPPQSSENTAKVHIFTPTKELPFAGHPNIGTAWVLGRRNADHPTTLVFEEIAGLVPIEIDYDAHGTVARTKLTAPHPLRSGLILPRATVAAAIGLRPDDINTESHMPMRVSVGTEILLVELTDTGALDRARPDTAKFREAVRRYPELKGDLEIYIYVRGRGAAIESRMFAPLLGIVEDPATGSAAAALAGLLASLDPRQQGEFSFEIRQGVAMGRESHIAAGARKRGAEIYATVAGGCVPVLRGVIDI